MSINNYIGAVPPPDPVLQDLAGKWVCRNGRSPDEIQETLNMLGIANDDT